MNLIGEYRRSLKSTASEEILDLAIYRPLAFLLVKTISKTRFTPNQITTLSLLTAVASAVCLAQNTPVALRWSAAVYAFANILDCADGQLARLQNSGTPLGRVWDGVADYLSSLAIFLAIWWISPAGTLWVVLLAAVSSAAHAGLFDYHQSMFIAARNNRGDFLQEEIDRFADEVSRNLSGGVNAVRTVLMRAYVLYLKMQERFARRITPREASDPRLIRFWSILGPTTNRTIFIFCALFGHVEIYLWIIVAGFNLWMIGCIFVQHTIPEHV